MKMTKLSKYASEWVWRGNSAYIAHTKMKARIPRALQLRSSQEGEPQKFLLFAWPFWYCNVYIYLNLFKLLTAMSTTFCPAVRRKMRRWNGVLCGASQLSNFRRASMVLMESYNEITRSTWLTWSVRMCFQVRCFQTSNPTVGGRHVRQPKLSMPCIAKWTLTTCGFCRSTGRTTLHAGLRTRWHWQTAPMNTFEILWGFKTLRVIPFEQ